MKYLIPLFIIIFLVSCKSEEEVFTGLSGTWDLVDIKVNSTVKGEEASSVDLPYEEYYQFRKDSTFSKYRNGDLISDGAFEKLENRENKTLFLLSFENKDANDTHQEQVSIEVNGDQFTESYIAYDGRTLYYEKR